MKINAESIPFEVGGDGQVTFHVGPEVQEDLLMLFRSNHWQAYRKCLMAAKNANMQILLGMEEPAKIQKQLGMVAGINLAINQIAMLVAQIEKARRVAEESKNQPEPTRQ